jgi:hypothetical protein
MGADIRDWVVPAASTTAVTSGQSSSVEQSNWAQLLCCDVMITSAWDAAAEGVFFFSIYPIVAAVLNSKEPDVRQSAVEVYRFLGRTIRDGDVLQHLAKGLVDLVSGTGVCAGIEHGRRTPEQ